MSGRPMTKPVPLTRTPSRARSPVVGSLATATPGELFDPSSHATAKNATTSTASSADVRRPVAISMMISSAAMAAIS